MLGIITFVQWYFLLHLSIIINGDATTRDWRILQSTQNVKIIIMVIATGLARTIVLSGMVDRYYKPLLSSKSIVFYMSLLKWVGHGLYISGMILFSLISNIKTAIFVYFMILPIVYYHFTIITYYAYRYYYQMLSVKEVFKRLRWGFTSISLLPSYEQIAIVYKSQWYFPIINALTFGLGYAYTTPRRLHEYSTIKIGKEVANESD